MAQFSTVGDIKTALESEVDDSVDLASFLRWMNACKDDLVAKISEEREEHFLTKSTLAVTGGTDEYLFSLLSPAPTGMIRLRRITDGDGNKIGRKDLNTRDYSWTMGYMLKGNYSIVFDPSPGVDATYYVWFYDMPVDFSSLTDVLPVRFPVNYLQLFLDYCLYRYYDSASYGDDKEMAITDLNIYNAKVGDMLSELHTDEGDVEQVETIPDGLE
jgi:hypothetical protein